MYLLFLAIALCCGIHPSLQADPWGKDADLVKRSVDTKCCKKQCATPLFGKFAEVMIGFHQDVISPADGPRSNFIPSSSQYTLDAMRKYGFFRGFTMGCDRLMRENKDPWVYQYTLDGAGDPIKYDPVR
ncbi:MAG TPA: membrane protein insertion efficiency factor YidD [Parachlamydiaceae bacterium]|nr:membrane protein insertion efficiency factor YidD [Parachlamydiaceae bacterium]